MGRSVTRSRLFGFVLFGSQGSGEPLVASLVMFFVTVTSRRLSHYFGTGA